MSSTILSLPLMLFVKEAYNRAYLDRTLSPIPEDMEDTLPDEGTLRRPGDGVSDAHFDIEGRNTQNAQNNSI